jgi:glycosyltransferase involved in cell wall biosynthesis
MRQIEDAAIVGILMATYNGEKYIEEQIESIVGQTYKNWELWIRDDCSSDKTLEIIKTYEKRDSRIKNIDSENKNLGALGNFSKILSLPYDFKYFMFCDQDDIWISRKIELSLIAINLQEKIYGKEAPILVHTDLRLVDHKGHNLHKSLFGNQGIKKIHPSPLHELMIENYITGCTLLFNKPLFEIATPLPKKIVMHDWWFALIAASTGKIVTLNDATVNYRQHSSNVVGAAKKNRFALISGWCKFREQMQERLAQLSILENHLHCKLKEESCIDIREFYFKAKKGGFASTFWIIKRGIKLQQFHRTLSLYFLILIRTL